MTFFHANDFRGTIVFLLSICAILPSLSVRGQSGTVASASSLVVVEAEGFKEYGGWVLDQQAMDQMGSAYLLAHGMGEPVKDATTLVTFPAPGDYRVWVRTWNWAAPWKTKAAPGRFQLLLDGKPLATTFGAEGESWGWRDGGTVKIEAKEAALALHDLTGFDGRCDAVLFAADPTFTPPNNLEALNTFRRKALGFPEKPAEAGTFDLVVVGGGIAGTCAAVSAARFGLKVALLQDRPVLGGNNSSEVRVHVGGNLMLPPYPKLGTVVNQMKPDQGGNAGPAENYEDEKKRRLVASEKNIKLFLDTHATGVEMRDGRIAAVTSRNVRSNEELRFAAPFFVDCTGDGTIGFLAAADFRVGRESRGETGEPLAPETADRQVMGTSVMWYAVPDKGTVPFPDCPWAIQFNDKTCQHAIKGDWDWETGMNKDQIVAAETIRDNGLRAVYGNWAFQKNQAKDKAKYQNMKLGWVAYIGGKRESRRLLGDVILRQQDIDGAKEYPDACVTTTWAIDLHYPNPTNHKDFSGDAFRSIAKFGKKKPYPIPYRCLYSRNIPNLFMAGRDISVTHVALGTVRVMGTGGMMGEVVGMAAAICVQKQCAPRDVYTKHLDTLKALMRTGVPPVAP